MMIIMMMMMKRNFCFFCYQVLCFFKINISFKNNSYSLSRLEALSTIWLP
uniref:Uncharacterized protein n=1 Tax=Octopus bimaculoides TaxID=37653 RepID=A0A0L8FXN8_OCTBM